MHRELESARSSAWFMSSKPLAPAAFTSGMWHRYPFFLMCIVGESVQPAFHDLSETPVPAIVISER
jgi:hypothetical protein